MARDYLAIPGSSTACERAFSSSGLIGSNRRMSLAPETFEAIQLVKSGYNAGDISAFTESQKYLVRAGISRLTPDVSAQDDEVQILSD
jgi:hypothetical protein